MKYMSWIMIAAIIVVIIIPMSIVTALAPDRDKQQDKQQEIVYESCRNITVFVKSENRNVELPLEEYVTCVVASEMPASFETEALKAQAVAARTYGIARQGTLCNTQHCQVYNSEEKIRADKGEAWMNTYWNKIRDAVYSTAGEIMYYNGEIAGQCVFSSSTGGKTENSEDVFVSAVPYLRSVSSEYEDEANHRNDVTKFNVLYFADALNAQTGIKQVTTTDVRNMKITARTEGGCVAALSVGKNTLTGKQIRQMFGLRSANFRIKVSDNKVIINSIGFGHGVGMSQYGANGMAKKGYTYDEILKHYYTGVDIEKINSSV